MKVFSLLSELKSLGKVTCTIGNFDGLHLGHLSLFEKMRQVAGSDPTLVITFSRHPLHVLFPSKAPKKICSVQHKLELFKSLDIDYVLLLEFTEKLAEQSYIEFLENLKNAVNFTHLVLGKDSSFGKGKEGNEVSVKKISSSLLFTPHYLDKFSSDNNPVSSGRIRNCIKEGNLSEASQLLGRPYSLYIDPLEDPLSGLELPPPGSYNVFFGPDKTLKKITISSTAPYIESKEKNFSLAEPLEITFLS